MKSKLITAALAFVGTLSVLLFLGSVGAYENGNISGLQFFWQLTTAVLLGVLVVGCVFFREVLNEYEELAEEYEALHEEFEDYREYFTKAERREFLHNVYKD